MSRRLRLSLLSVTALVLVATTVPAVAQPRTPGPDDPGTIARRNLTTDASGALAVHRDPGGRVQFVGTRAGAGIDNPLVRPGASVASAARAHLDRYGASLGAAPRSSFVRRSAARSVSGVDVVAYVQEIDGVPVLGGEVVLGLGAGHDLRSLSAVVTPHAAVTTPTVEPSEAALIARRLVRRSYPHADLTVADHGRHVLDPVVAGLDVPGGPRTVRRLEVSDGAGVRELVLVDDRTAVVVFRTSLIQAADRVVCDQGNVTAAEAPCTSGFARTEGQPATGVVDVDAAFDLSGAVAEFYQEIAGADLTADLGIDVGGTRKLASTVRYCTADPADACPYENAFWNGQQMYYGAGFAAADDVVAHEMTHGFIDQHSRLFYWGQSGAINESMADVIGEIVDHRHPSAGDVASDWRLGEDLPFGAIRDLADPPAAGQPDRTTSVLYSNDYGDNSGVHTNSGIANKTAYLISQGGSFNGQAITGIDAGDPSLTRTAKLYVDVITRLGSGADFAALARQLDQSCQDLSAQGTAGFTAAHCTAVHQAGVATQLTTTPTNAAQPTPAPTTCPAGTVRRNLFDSEAGDPLSHFEPASGWARTSEPGASNATSGTESWFAVDPDTTQTNTLRTAAAIAVPEDQPTYLSFKGWHLLDYEHPDYYDGGTVEVAMNGGTAQPVPSAAWTNGPTQLLTSAWGNPNAGLRAFAGDSLGWVGSRLDLSSFGGTSVRPQFTMRSDSAVGFIGWFLDDIAVYTCDRVVPSAVRGLRVLGALNGMTVQWSPPAVNVGAVTGYRIGVATCGISRTLPATATSVKLAVSGSRCGATFDVSVSALGYGGEPSAPVRSRALLARATLQASRSGAHLTFKGALGTSLGQLPGHYVRIQRQRATGWVTIKTVKSGTRGKFTVKIRHRKRAYYRTAYFGGLGLVGGTSARHRW